MENRIVDIHNYRFGRSIGIMLLRPLSENIHDVSFIDHMAGYNPDIVIGIGLHPEMNELYKILSLQYKNSLFFDILSTETGVIFSRYPIKLLGILYPDSSDLSIYNISTGPDSKGLNIVYINSDVLSDVSNLSELWFIDKLNTPAFYVDHSYMVARKLQVLGQGDEQAMRNSDMKLVYYNFRIQDDKI